MAREGRIGVDPRHVEAWMRSEHETLDGLGDWKGSVLAAVACVDAAGPAMNEALAASFAL